MRHANGRFRPRSNIGLASGIIIDGNIGMPFPKDVVLTLDIGAGRLWIKR